MDESTFETFDEELGATQKDVLQPKPSRQSRQPDSLRIPPSSEMYPQRRVREEPLGVQQIPKSLPREAPASRGVPLRKSLSIQNMAQIEAPWEGVTLNRCLFLAITILVLTSGCQRLQEFLRGRKDGSDLEPMGTALNVRNAAVRKYRVSAPEPEASFWDTFFWWVNEDDDDEEDSSRRGRSRKLTREKATRGLRHKEIPDRGLLKGREGRFKAQRKKARLEESQDKSQDNLKRLRKKKLEKKEEEEQEEKAEKMTSKKSKKKAL